MSSADPINANPTVLDASQLPTRHESKSSTIQSQGLGKQEELNYYNQLYEFSLFNSELITKQRSYDDLTLPKIESDETIMSISSGFEDITLRSQQPSQTGSNDDSNCEEQEPIDAQEIYDLISTISDPEHPLTLGQLAVVNLNDIEVSNNPNHSQLSEIIIYITPTITHCSLATLIGLGIKVRLERCLPKRFRVTILLKEGSHQSENQVNKQLNDKERVSAACENDQLLKVIGHMFATCQ
ncbi:unnamed protein product [Ambrosiozyma monospora]|uniref:Unnamed protein product n=1 Tax=Ambrosiozyma monospora TaxID=43982 RepID=A0ACB5T5F2_AMBMO|nr:unnamed protein product [Ambrosiozyma monospora]